MKKTTRSITHGAITAAITVILILIDRIFAGFLMSLLPLPLIVYGLYYTVKESILVYIVTVILVAIFPGQLPATVLMIVYGVVGIIYIAVFKTNIQKIFKFVSVFLGLSVAYVLMVLFFGEFFGLSFSTTLKEVETIFKITNPKWIRYGAYLMIVASVTLETFVIFMSADLIKQRMKLHRK